MLQKSNHSKKRILNFSKRGQVKLYLLMVGLTVLVLALALAPSVSQATNNAMNDTIGNQLGMNCTSPVNDFIRVSCLATDLSLFYFIGTLVFISGAIFAGRIIGGQ